MYKHRKVKKNEKMDKSQDYNGSDLTCGGPVSQGECEGVLGGPELVGDAQLVVAPGVSLHDLGNGESCGEHAVIGPVLQHVGGEPLVEGLGALHDLALVVHGPEHLGGPGVGAEADQDLLLLPQDQVVERLGLVCGDGLELNVEVNGGHVLVHLDVLAIEALVVHDAGDGLAIVGGVGIVVEHLDLPHGAVLVPGGLLVLDSALESVLAQGPGEGGSGSGAIGNAGNLKEKSLLHFL